MPEDYGMNPRPLLRSASFDYLSTPRQVKNRMASNVQRSAFGVWRLAFGVWRLAFGAFLVNIRIITDTVSYANRSKCPIPAD